MIRTLLFFLLTFNIFHLCCAQGKWTWMKGDSTSNSPGHFGTQGVPDPANHPPYLYEAGQWTDRHGNFWLFGGVDFTANKYRSALWKYDVSINAWTWVKGDSTNNEHGVYGTMGIPDPANKPGARAFGFYTWVDADNHLWLYGGSGNGASGGHGALSDLWKYNITTNEWTWMSGNTIINQNPVYGTFQVFDPNNNPGERQEGTCAWVDSSGNMWLYGGASYYYAQGEYYGDMWVYDPSISQWAWMQGADTFAAPPVYGTKGVFNASNTPGGRETYACWVDHKNMFWLFGGLNFENYGEWLSDLWVFDPSIYQWAWISGSSTGNSPGNAGALCDTSSTFFPSGRFENKASWTDSCGNFWNFGGFGPFSTFLNDLWVYNSTDHTWAWVSGDLIPNSLGHYGIQGLASPLNKPPGKIGPVSWRDGNGNLWLFGGIAYNNSRGGNDLWKFTPDTLCPKLPKCAPQPIASLTASDTTVCEKFCIDFFDQSTNNPVSWLWQFPGAIPSFSIDQNPVNICYDNPGTFDVTLITTNPGGVSDTLILFDFITVYTNPFAPTITQTGNVLTSSPADFYQWYLNSVIIPGATNQSITITQTGLFTVEIADSNGCTAQSSVDAVFVGIDTVNDDYAISIYPNPSNGNFILEWTNALSAVSAWAEEAEQNEISVKVINTLGQTVFTYQEKISSVGWKKEIDLSNEPPAIYFLQLQNGKYFLQQKIVISK